MSASGGTRSRRGRRGFGWGVIDQAFASMTSLALSIVGAQLLGPAGLGVVAIGFSAYLLAVNLLRTILTEPSVVRSTPMDEADRVVASRASLTFALVLGCASAGFFGVLGWALTGPIGEGLLLFAPWLLPALVNELCRALLFRDGRGRGAALNEGFWLATMLAAIPLAVVADARWAVVATWGIGATAAAALGIAQLRLVPLGLRAGLGWWRRESWPLGRWFAGAGMIMAVSGQAVILSLAALLGPAAVGGLRAAQTLFAPLTLLGTAAALPGLPALTRSLSVSLRAAKALAARMGGVIAALALGYLVVAGAVREPLLGALFGDEFRTYDWLIVPVGAQQLLLAVGLGFLLLLKANGQGRDLVWVRTISATATLAVTFALASSNGLEGAAWGLAVGTGLTSALLAWRALLPSSRVRSLLPVPGSSHGQG